MSELTIGQLIKIILGILVFAIVVAAVAFFFKNSVIDFFKNLGGNSSGKIILGLVR